MESNKTLLKNIYYGFLHLLVGFTSIVVVANIVGFNLKNCFLAVGIGTILYHIFTKNKVATLLGISGSYIAGMAYVGKQFGHEYVLGGVVVSGLIYVLIGLLMWKYQEKVLKYIPNWLLSTAILLIGLMLVPIGKSMISSNIVVGLTAMIVTVLVTLFSKNKLSIFAVPIGILIATIVQIIFFGIDTTILSQSLTYEFVKPKFCLASFTAIGICAIPVAMELLGDTYNTSLAMKEDLFKTVGIHKIAMGNGISSILSGSLLNSLPLTSYSENAGFLFLSKYTNPTAQIFTGLFCILLSFCTPILKLTMLIPSSALGGIALYLYSLIIVNAIKEITKNIDLENNKRELTIITLMIAIFYVDFIINGIIISSIAIATVLGILLNVILPKKTIKGC